MRSILTAVVGALALIATGPAAVGPSPTAGTPRVSTAGGSAHTPRADATRSAVDALIAEIESTADGTFSATYHVGPPPSPSGPTDTVTVAQRAAPGVPASLEWRGRFAYSVVSSDGSTLEWSLAGTRATWCQRLTRRSRLVCGGPLTVVAANGFIRSIEPFVPGAAVSASRPSSCSRTGRSPRLT